MDTLNILFYIAGGVCLVLAAVSGISLAVMRKRVDTVTGTIVDIRLTNAETMKLANSKWAHMLYYIDGKEYVSHNRIQVPMSSRVGDKRKINYIIDDPQKLYSQSLKNVLIFSFIAVLCALTAYLLGR
jgi:hypothetical protein